MEDALRLNEALQKPAIFKLELKEKMDNVARAKEALELQEN